jgi:two-component system, NarL family, response regulator NreC
MKILIIDDHDILHLAIQNIISSVWPDASYTSVWESNDAIEQCKHIVFDLILLDLSMPTVTDGLNVLLKMRNLQKQAKIVILTAHEEEKYQHLTYQYGADGFLLKIQNKNHLTRQIAQIMNNEKIFVNQVYNESLCQLELYSWKKIISIREKEVLVLTIRGFTQKEIAEILGISAKTVNNHRTNIMEKLNSGKHSDWLNFAVHHNLVEFK